MKIGFIGTGIMGSSMIRHLLKAGHTVYVYNRTQSKAMPLVEEGALWQDTPAQIAENAEVIMTMVGYPQDVEEVYFGEEGVFAGLSEGKIIVDMTTSTPTLAQKIAGEAEKIGVASLDAPVSGGDIGAQKGILTVMVGGKREAYEKIYPLFECFSSECRLFGDAGSGQMTKVANQIMVAGTMTGLIEMMVYAKKTGLPLEQVVKTVNGGAARNFSLENYGPRIIKEDYSPSFFVKHFVKDLKIALDEAEKMNLDLPCTAQAYALYKKLEDKGYGDEGTQSLVKLWWD